MKRNPSQTAMLSNHLRDSGRPGNPDNRLSHSNTSKAAMYLKETKTREYISIGTIAIRKINHDDDTILRGDQRLRFIASSRKTIENRPPPSATKPLKHAMLQ